MLFFSQPDCQGDGLPAFANYEQDVSFGPIKNPYTFLSFALSRKLESAEQLDVNQFGQDGGQTEP